MIKYLKMSGAHPGSLPGSNDALVMTRQYILTHIEAFFLPFSPTFTHSRASISFPTKYFIAKATGQIRVSKFGHWLKPLCSANDVHFSY
jgi:hypothetical protein